MIDNNETNRGTLEIFLRRDFERVQTCADISSALAAIQAGHFHAIFVDDKLHHEGRRGRQAGSSVPALRAAAPDAFILAYSGTAPDDPNYRESIKAVGADDFVNFQDVIGNVRAWAPKVGARNLLHLSSLVILTPSDLATRAALETVGANVLQTVLLSLIAPGRVSIKALSSGFSGDPVFWVVHQSNLPMIHEVTHIVKLSRDRWSLSQEFQGAPTTAQSFHAIKMQKLLPNPINGWWAGIAPAVKNAKSLEEVLSGARASGNSAAQHARRVWSDVLREPFAQAQFDAPGAPSRALTARFAQSVVVAANDLSEVLGTVYGRDVQANAIRRLAAKVSDKEGRIWPYRAGEETWCQAHGDFHLRNILWKGGLPWVIDWALVGVAPRCNDTCNLIVDAVCRGVELPVKARWQMAKTDADLKLFLRLVETPGKFRGSSRPTISFASALFEELGTAGAGPPEIARALSFNLLRYMRFESLPTPRRVLAALSVAAIVDEYGV